jgi:hypothetical protein
MARAIEAGLGDDGIMLRDCLKKLIGARRGQPLVLDDAGDFPALSGPEDIKPAIATVSRGLAEGRLTPEEALHLSETLCKLAPTFAAARAEPSAEEDAKEGDRVLAEIEQKLERLARQLAEDAEAAATEGAKAGDAEAAAMAAAWPLVAGTVTEEAAGA